jgi:hypothetical protein
VTTLRVRHAGKAPVAAVRSGRRLRTSALVKQDERVWRPPIADGDACVSESALADVGRLSAKDAQVVAQTDRLAPEHAALDRSALVAGEIGPRRGA